LLVNEWVGLSVAVRLGLPVPRFAAVEVSPDVAEFVRFDIGTDRHHPKPGLHFASAYVENAHDILLDEHLREVTNLRDFWGCLILDKWLCNVDGRQAIFTNYNTANFQAQFMDFGFCLNAENWTFQADTPLRGLYSRHVVYNGVRSLSDFSRWLAAVGGVSLTSIRRTIPKQWLEGDAAEAFSAVVKQLDNRRAIIENLITSAREARQYAFPDWGGEQA
jgi:hypothetical protein